MPNRAATDDYDHKIAELRRHAEAETRKTLRDAQIFAGLLLALAATAIYGLAQLAGIA